MCLSVLQVIFHRCLSTSSFLVRSRFLIGGWFPLGITSVPLGSVEQASCPDRLPEEKELALVPRVLRIPLESWIQSPALALAWQVHRTSQRWPKA